MQAEHRTLIQRLDDDDGLRFSLLSSFDGTADEFLVLRRSMWPDQNFYHPGFSHRRMKFAIAITCAPKVSTMAPSMIRSILELDNMNKQHLLDFHVRNSFGKTIFHGLASKIATTAGLQVSTDWHRLTCEIMSCVTNVSDLNQDSNSTYMLLVSDRPHVLDIRQHMVGSVW